MSTRLVSCALLVVGLFGFAAQPTLADDFRMKDHCGQSAAAMNAELKTMLLGDWTLTIKRGLIIEDGKVSAPDIGEIKQADTMVLRGGDLTLEPFAALETLNLEFTDEGHWQFDGTPHLPPGTTVPKDVTLPRLDVTDTDLETITGCKIDDLPRLIGRGQNTVRGVSMDFTVRMMMVNPDLFYGFDVVPTEVKGHHFEGRQVFTLERAGTAS